MKWNKTILAFLASLVFCVFFYFFFKPTTSSPPLYVFFDHHQQVAADLPEHLKRIHTLLPVWLYLKDAEGEIAHHSLKQQQEIESVVKNAARIVPVINNHNGIIWQIQTVESLIKDREKQKVLLDRIISYLKRSQFQMINFDFEAFSEELIPSYFSFLEFAAERLHKEKFQISVCVAPYWIPQLSQSHSSFLDLIILMLYDEHWSTSKPGPISSQPWFEKVYAQFNTLLPSEKLVVGIGNYGYDWPQEGPANDLSVLEVLSIAERYHAQIVKDTSSGNPMFRYVDDKQNRHEVWFLDASTFKLQYSFLNGKPVAGAALWQMGSEDPKLWTILKEP